MATMDDLEQLKREISEVGSVQAQLFMITRDKNTEQSFFVHKSEITDQISTAFVGLVTHLLEDVIRKQPEVSVYDIEDVTGETIQFIDQGEVPFAGHIVQPILVTDATPSLTDLSDEFLKKLWAYAVKIQYGNKEIIFFRKYSRNKILKQNIFDAVVFKNGRFSAMEDDVFQIDSQIDCMLLNSELIIFQTNNFEKIFGFDDLYEVAANQAMEQIEQTFNFIDAEVLASFVSTDSNKQRKLASIMKSGSYANFGFAEVCATIQNYNLDIEVDMENQKVNLTKKNAVRLLKIINEDYLQSEVTKNRFESSSKRKR